MTIENPPFEDVSPIKKWGCSIAIFVFMGVNPYFAEVGYPSKGLGFQPTIPHSWHCSRAVQSCGAGCA